jgi:flagellar basal body-associated protein FliL
MLRQLPILAWLTCLVFLIAGGCATPPPPYNTDECPTYSDLGPLRANPAGALDRHLQIEVSFKVCPPEAGLAEIQRKHIELKHDLLSLLSAKTQAQLEDPLRIENLRVEIHQMVNKKIMKKNRVEEVFVTAFELE